MKKKPIPVGKHFGRWTVIKELPTKNGKTMCLCRCSCNRNIERAVYNTNLLRGLSTSCGCLSIEKTIKRNKSLAYNNIYTKYGDCYICTLPNDLHFMVDVDDYAKVSRYSWVLSNSGYPVASLGTAKAGHIYLHQLIMGKSQDYDIDHINHDKLDNRKVNLRIVTHSENILNAKLNKNNKSGHKGVSWNKAYKKWESFITINKKHIYLGRYDNINEAVLARKVYEDTHNIIS